MTRNIAADPDIVAEVCLLPSTTARGGKSVVPWFGCPLEVGGQYFDCRISLSGGALQPGKAATVGIAFLAPELAMDHLSVGTEFSLWESGTIGHGRVLEVKRVI